ncbi:MAG TPA: 16S rRNA (guanine(966)-N(2))-methyltransferase RsmD [Desulfomonilia bacterium]
MSVRICSGLYKSRRIACPEDIRPTSDRVKEALFSALLVDFRDIDVLDVFAGSGSLGIEALSRGAKTATFVDSSALSINHIRKNASLLGIENKCVIIRSDVMAYIRKCRHSFDLVFMDPPYNKGLASQLAPELYFLIKPGGTMVVEHSPREALNMNTYKQKQYGDTMLTFIRREP